MMKDSKILLAVILLCTVVLAGLQLYLHRQSLSLNLRAAQEIYSTEKDLFHLLSIRRSS